MQTQNSPNLGRFSIIRQLGRGLHGVVFLAHDPYLRRRVAIKVLHADPAVLTPTISPQARNLARLRHPNIISLYDVGIAGNRVYLVCEYLEGNDLRAEIRERGALPLPEAVSIAKQILDGMAFAHARGILHMDLTPANVMRDREGRPRIMDFDLSRVAGAPWAGELTGTLRYISPEHTTTRNLDARTDVYTLGLIAYELITGVPAVSGDNHDAIVRQIRQALIDWEPLQERDPAGAVTAVLKTALQRDPDARYPDAGAMLEALTQAARHISYIGGEQDPPLHGTIEFVLHRIQRKGDFPAISRTLIEFNRLTAADSHAQADKLANAILRDDAMTKGLLKLANSAFFGIFSGEVRDVADAIRVLGPDQVCTACNVLACLGHFNAKTASQELQDALIGSLVAGVMTRFLAARCGIKDVEEAFICGMLHDLGRTLTLYYFREDYRDIEELIAQGADRDTAARSTIGIRYPELGYTVARAWMFPEIVLYSMADEDMRVSTPAARHAQTLRCLSVFANGLCAQAAGGNLDGVLPRLCALLDDVGYIIDLKPQHAMTLFAAALDRFRRFAPVLEVNPKESRFINQAVAWLAVAMAGTQRAETEGSAKYARDDRQWKTRTSICPRS
ncbi:MAG: protein kinase domain-containing protein [Chromatiales bacterium]